MNIELITILIVAIIVIELTRYTKWGRTLCTKGSENVLSAHPIYNVCLKPNSYAKIYDPKKWDDYSHIIKYDSNGLRYNNTPNSIQQKDDEFRILIIGDSMVQSREVPYEYTFPVLLEQILKNNFPKVKVFSYGVSGWSTLTEYLYYKTDGYRFLADLVITCFFLNDFTEDYILQDRIIFNRKNIPVSIAPKDPGRVVQEILNNLNHESKSIVFRLIKLGIKIIKETFNRKELRKRYKQSPKFHKRENLCMDYLAILNENFSKNELEVIDRTLNYMSLLNDEVKKNDAKMLLMCIPFPQQVNLKQCGIMYDVWNYHSNDSSGKPQLIIQNFLENKHIDFLDILPEFKKNGDNEEYFFGATAHLNKVGSKKVAEILASHISKKMK